MTDHKSPAQWAEEFAKYQRWAKEQAYHVEDAEAFEEWYFDKESLTRYQDLYEFVENLFDTDGMVRADIVGDEPEQGQDNLINVLHEIWNMIEPDVAPNAVYVLAQAAYDQVTSEE